MPAPASARQFLLSPYPTHSLAASCDENHILYSSCAKAPFCPAVLVLTKSILSSNRAFALIQSILSRSLRKGGQSCGPYHDRHGLVADDSSLTSIENRDGWGSRAKRREWGTGESTFTRRAQCRGICASALAGSRKPIPSDSP